MILGFYHEEDESIVESGEYDIGVMSIITPLNMPNNTLNEVWS